jgi:hypothetical protein
MISSRFGIAVVVVVVVVVVAVFTLGVLTENREDKRK